MANATNIVVTDLVANGTAAVTPNLRTNDTAAVSGFTIAGAGVTDRLVLIVQSLNTEATNVASSCMYVTINAGDNPPAFRAGLGSLTKSAIYPISITNATSIGLNAVAIGPFETGRFIQDDGTLTVNIGADGATNTPHLWSIMALKLPVV